MKNLVLKIVKVKMKLSVHAAACHEGIWWNGSIGSPLS
jgi:hypothetical protein